MENYILWAWGINGMASVVGSVMTVVIAISFGFTEALLTGAGLYFFLFLMFQLSWWSAKLPAPKPVTQT